MNCKFCPAILLLTLGSLTFAIPGCRQHPSDDTMAKNIQAKIAADPDTKDTQVNVTVKDGKVTLTGSVTSQAARQKAEQIAMAEPGETSIDDLTAIQPDTATAADAGSSVPPAPATSRSGVPAKPASSTTAQPGPAAASPAPVAAVNPAPVVAPAPLPPLVLSAGTVLTVRTSQALGSKISQDGQTFLAVLAQPVSVKGQTAIPRGATVSGKVVTAKEKGRIKGEGELALSLTSVSMRGQTYKIQTEVLSSTIKGKGTRTAETTGGGAAGGALIGGLAGGGKGAGIGALAGAGAGFVGGLFTGNKQITIPAESTLSFHLTAQVELPRPAPGSAEEPARQKLSPPTQ